MHITKLNQNQSLRAGIVFLNMLGIQVVPQPIYVEDKVAYPLLFGNKQSGYMTLNEQIGKVSMEIDNDEIYLTSHYDIPTVSGMKDEESGFRGIVFVDWSSIIGFTIQRKSDEAIFSGTMRLNSSADKEFGKKCSMHADMEISNSNLGNYTLKLYNDGYNFLYYNKNDKDQEELGVRYIQERIYHDISTDFDENDEWQTRNIAGATMLNYGKQIRKYNALQKIINGHIEDIRFDEDVIDTLDKENQLSTLIQLGNEARSMAPKMARRIQDIRKDLKIGHISLLDALLETTFRNKELISATFGYTPHNVAWQNGTNSLKDAYFGDYSTTFSSLQSGESELIK